VPQIAAMLQMSDDQRLAYEQQLARQGAAISLAPEVVTIPPPPAAGDNGPLEIVRAPGMPAGMGDAVVINRSSSGWRFTARPTLETWPPNGPSPKLKRIAGSPMPAPEKAWWIRCSISASGSFLLATNSVSRATRMDTLPIWRTLTNAMRQTAAQNNRRSLRQYNPAQAMETRAQL